MSIKENFKETWKKLLDSPQARRVRKLLRRLVMALIVVLVLYQLFEIGWGEVMRNLPKQPMFYLLFVVLFLTLPVAEVLIYQQVWVVKKWDTFKAFISKKVLNEEVMGYSGEVYLFMWARERMQTGDKEILKHIRDNSILSALSSNIVAVSLIGVLVFTGIIDLQELVADVNLLYAAAILFMVVLLIALFIQFREYLFSLPFGKAIKIFSIYITRFTLHHGLLIVQWAVVLPATPLSIWLVYVAITIVVNRLPFIPSKDLVFMWAGIELSRVLDVATAAIAGMLLVSSVLNKCTNLLLYMIISYYDKGAKLKAADADSTELPDPEEETNSR